MVRFIFLLKQEECDDSLKSQVRHYPLPRLMEQVTSSSSGGQVPEADSSKQGARNDYKVISNALRALAHLARGDDANSTLPIYEVVGFS